MESKNDLEETYSREQQRLGDGLEAVATPVALVRSVTSRSQRSAKSGKSSRSRRNSSPFPCHEVAWIVLLMRDEQEKKARVQHICGIWIKS